MSGLRRRIYVRLSDGAYMWEAVQHRQCHHSGRSMDSASPAQAHWSCDASLPTGPNPCPPLMNPPPGPLIELVLSRVARGGRLASAESFCILRASCSRSNAINPSSASDPCSISWYSRKTLKRSLWATTGQCARLLMNISNRHRLCSMKEGELVRKKFFSGRGSRPARSASVKFFISWFSNNMKSRYRFEMSHFLPAAFTQKTYCVYSEGKHSRVLSRCCTGCFA
mmetsp:Transcript_9588/g.22732  ORF Transcript_9588/g.22732 Transcript_9588/m.22732 type:complete len:225 (+) Transcript_9588:479-1153(+)